MKKYLFGIVAVVFAIGLSAFSHPSKRVQTGYYFDTQWRTLENVPCDGTLHNCVIEIDNTPRQIYASQSFSDPLKFD